MNEVSKCLICLYWFQDINYVLTVEHCHNLVNTLPCDICNKCKFDVSTLSICIIISTSIIIFVRPDITVMVGWALKINYIYLLLLVVLTVILRFVKLLFFFNIFTFYLLLFFLFLLFLFNSI